MVDEVVSINLLSICRCVEIVGVYYVSYSKLSKFIELG